MRIKQAFLLAAMSFTLLPAMAAAQAFPGGIMGAFNTPTGDPYSSILLHQIFGPLFPVDTGGGLRADPTIFSLLIGYFNIAVLLIGGLLFFWNVTVGLLQTAHEGQVLGQRWSSLWAPLRVVFAVGLLVPIPTYGGYNVAQAGVAYLVKGATNIASVVWSEAATLVLANDFPITAPVVSFSPELMRTLYDNEVCLRLVQHQVGLANSSATVAYRTPAALREGNTPLAPPPTDFDSSNLVAPGIGTNPAPDELHSLLSGFNRRGARITALETGDTATQFSALGICGMWRTPDIPAYIDNLIARRSAGDSEAAAVRNLFVAGHEEIMLEVTSELRSVVDRLWDQIHQGANGGVQNVEPPDIAADIVRVTELANSMTIGLNRRLMDAAVTAAGGNSVREVLLQRITGGGCVTGDPSDDGVRRDTAACFGEGWIGAGSWYMTMARLNNEITSLLSATPTVRGPTYAFNQGQLYEDIGGRGTGQFLIFRTGRITDDDLQNSGLPSEREAQLIFNRFEEAFDRSTIRLATLGYDLSITQVNNLTNLETDDVFGRMPRLENWMMRTTQQWMDFFDPSKGGRDPMIGLISAGHFMMNLAGTILAGVGVASWLPGSIGTSTAIMILPIFSVFLAAGVTLTFILPLMPFFYWVLAVTGYFLVVVEAVIAVNLWALSHLRMDGEGLSGEAGRQGWVMFLAILLTPVLMVFGFIVGMVIFRVTSDLISGGLFYTVGALQGANLWIGILGLVAFSIVIVTAYIFLLERSFSMVSELPNRVMYWMGSRIDITGGESRIQAAAAAGAIGVNQAGNQIEKSALSQRIGPDGKMQNTGIFPMIGNAFTAARNYASKNNVRKS